MFKRLQIGIEYLIYEGFKVSLNNLNYKKNMISGFNYVRDLPYTIVPNTLNYEESLKCIINSGIGSCSPKHYLLGKIFEEMGIPTFYVTNQFYWKDLDIEYPNEIRLLAEKMPINYHLACKIYIDNKMVFVDASWDLLLKKGGFRVNENWDGFSNTLNAVKPLDELVHETPLERIEYIKNILKYEKNNGNRDFYNKLNKWLWRVRNCKN